MINFFQNADDRRLRVDTNSERCCTLLNDLHQSDHISIEARAVLNDLRSNPTRLTGRNGPVNNSEPWRLLIAMQWYHPFANKLMC